MKCSACGSLFVAVLVSASWVRAEDRAPFDPPGEVEVSPPDVLPTNPPLVLRPVASALPVPLLAVRAGMSSSSATYTRAPSKLGVAFVAGGLATAVLGSVLIWKVTARPQCDKGECVWIPPLITAMGGAGIAIGVLLVVFDKPTPAVMVKALPVPSVALGPGGGSLQLAF